MKIKNALTLEDGIAKFNAAHTDDERQEILNRLTVIQIKEFAETKGFEIRRKHDTRKADIIETFIVLYHDDLEVQLSQCVSQKDVMDFVKSNNLTISEFKSVAALLDVKLEESYLEDMAIEFFKKEILPHYLNKNGIELMKHHKRVKELLDDVQTLEQKRKILIRCDYKILYSLCGNTGYDICDIYNISPCTPKLDLINKLLDYFSELHNTDLSNPDNARELINHADNSDTLGRDAQTKLKRAA